MPTHYTPYFAERFGQRLHRAVCGALITMRDHRVEPGCQKCKAWLEADDAEAKALSAKWDEEARKHV